MIIFLIILFFIASFCLVAAPVIVRLAKGKDVSQSQTEYPDRHVRILKIVATVVMALILIIITLGSYGYISIH